MTYVTWTQVRVSGADVHLGVGHLKPRKGGYVDMDPKLDMLNKCFFNILCMNTSSNQYIFFMKFVDQAHLEA